MSPSNLNSTQQPKWHFKNGNHIKTILLLKPLPVALQINSTTLPQPTRPYSGPRPPRQSHLYHSFSCPLYSDYASVFFSVLNTLDSFPREDFHICYFLCLKSSAFTFRLLILISRVLALNFTSQRSFSWPPHISTRWCLTLLSQLNNCFNVFLLYNSPIVCKLREGKDPPLFWALLYTQAPRACQV